MQKKSSIDQTSNNVVFVVYSIGSSILTSPAKENTHIQILLSTLVWSANDLWQQLELPSELESDLQDTLDWGSK